MADSSLTEHVLVSRDDSCASTFLVGGLSVAGLGSDSAMSNAFNSDSMA